MTSVKNDKAIVESSPEAKNELPLLMALEFNKLYTGWFNYRNLYKEGIFEIKISF